MTNRVSSSGPTTPSLLANQEATRGLLIRLQFSERGLPVEAWPESEAFGLPNHTRAITSAQLAEAAPSVVLCAISTACVGSALG